MTFTHLSSVLAEVEELAALFRAADRRLYLVGGIVRDLWLDRGIDADSDIDLTTDATPSETKSIVADWADAVWLQGERFGTIGARHGGRSLEITTHRAEVYTPASRKPEVVFGTEVDVDLSRRDFTVNAMAIDAAGGELVDPYEGTADLRERRLRTPLDAEVSFADDPLRMLRAARFITRYELVPAPELFAAAISLRDRMQIVSAERMRDELEKLLGAPSVDHGLAFLVETQLLERVIPGAAGSAGEQSVALAGSVPGPWWLRLAALLYPLDADPNETLRAMRCSRELRGTVSRVVEGAKFLISEAGTEDSAAIDDATLRRWVAMVRPQEEASMTLAQAAGLDQAIEAAWRELGQREDLGDFEPPLTGPDIMDALNIEAGPKIGQAMRAVRDRRIQDGPLSHDDALTIVREWAATNEAGADTPAE